MNNFFENRIIKLISPINNECFTIELSGDENELKELIATIINVPSSSIKGIKDSFDNYYTLSCAIKNPRLNSNFSSSYLIVINNNNLFNDNYSNENQKKDLNYSKTQIIHNSNFNFPNVELNALKNKNDININNNNNYNNNYNINNFNFNNNNLNLQTINPNEKILLNLLENKLIDEKIYYKLREMLLEENEEILTLFKLYNNHKNLKKLFYQLKPVLEGVNDSIRKKNTNQIERKDSGGNYNISYNMILDSIENEINSKNDMALLRKLILCDNEQILKIMEMYEYDNNRKKLLNRLNYLLSKYRGRFSVPNNNIINPEELKLIKKVDKIETKILKCISNDANFKQDWILLFKYDMNRLDVYQKMELFTNTFKIKNSSYLTENNKSYIKQYYQNLMLTSFFPSEQANKL